MALTKDWKLESEADEVEDSAAAAEEVDEDAEGEGSAADEVDECVEVEGSTDAVDEVDEGVGGAAVESRCCGRVAS